MSKYPQKTKINLSKYIPLSVCIFVLLLNTLYFSIYSPKVLSPIIYIFIFFFSIYNPSCFKLYHVFFLGILADLLTSCFFGLQLFNFMFISYTIYLSRSFLLRYSFVRLWIFFSSLTILMFILDNLLVFLSNHQLIPFFPQLISYFLIVCLYPLIILLCNWINKKVFGEYHD